jgi:hypothetical protein
MRALQSLSLIVMLMLALNSLTTSVKEIIGNRRSLAIFFAVYLALIGASALFIVTSLATFQAVFLTFLSIVLMPAIFFLFQTMCLSFTAKTDAKELVKNSLHKFRKLFLVSLPIIVLAILVYRLFALIENENVFLSALRFLLFAFVFPLTLIHLWIETLRSDVVDALKNLPAVLSKAFAPLSVLIYFIGLIVFAFIPYLLLAPQIRLQQSNVVIGLLILRLIVAFLFMFFGWIVTVNALSQTTKYD